MPVGEASVKKLAAVAGKGSCDLLGGPLEVSFSTVTCLLEPGLEARQQAVSVLGRPLQDWATFWQRRACTLPLTLLVPVMPWRDRPLSRVTKCLVEGFVWVPRGGSCRQLGAASLGNQGDPET